MISCCVGRFSKRGNSVLLCFLKHSVAQNGAFCSPLRSRQVKVHPSGLGNEGTGVRGGDAHDLPTLSGVAARCNYTRRNVESSINSVRPGADCTVTCASFALRGTRKTVLTCFLLFSFLYFLCFFSVLFLFSCPYGRVSSSF